MVRVGPSVLIRSAKQRGSGSQRKIFDTVYGQTACFMFRHVKSIIRHSFIKVFQEINGCNMTLLDKT